MLTYQLDRRAGEPLYVQLYRDVRDDIETGALPAGEKLPSKRALANHLGLSVITVEGAYAQLAAEGYIESRPRCGFFICAGGERKQRYGCAARLPGEQCGVAADARASVERQARAARELLADLTGASAPAGLFPYAAWARTLRRVLSNGSEEAMISSSDGRGTYQLRRAIANHLRGFRGMEVSPDQVVIGSGAQSFYGLLVQLLGRRRIFAIENPGYPRLASIYESNDVAVRFVEMDDKGPMPAALEASGASVFHCMPSHQFPTGVTTSVARRRQLLEWAAAPASDGERRYLIEDDFDCEFRMSGRPVPPLQALDEEESVIYANTFTKTLGAAFRIGYMVLPPHLAERFQQQLGFYACTVGALEQLTLAQFMESGEYERHVNRQRTHFRKLQNAFATALTEADGEGRLRLVNLGAGLHFVMEVAGAPGERSVAEAEEAIAAHAAQQGVLLAPQSRYCFTGAALTPSSQRSPSFLVNCTALAPEAIAPAARAIVRAVEETVV